MNVGFYVTLRRDSRIIRLAGPFQDHDAAVGMVDEARRVATEIDPFVDFDGVGTAKLTTRLALPHGVLNGRLGLEVWP